MFNDYFREKRVFITGHTGFKGAWLSWWLLQLGATVKGYAFAPYTQDDLFVVTTLEKHLQSTIADIRDADFLSREISDFQPDIVIHMAAQPLVRLSYEYPRLTYETNVMGTLNVLEAVRKCDAVRLFLNVTTDKCYENSSKREGYTETDPLGGFDPYSSSKACSELLTSAYRRSYFQNGTLILSARAGNVIGGGDWCKDRIVPDSIRSLIKQEPIVVRSPKAVRPWQHVLEPLSGYLNVIAESDADRGIIAGSWNFGPDPTDTLTVAQLVDQLILSWGSGEWRDGSDPSQPHEAAYLTLNCDKAKQYLKWSPVFSQVDSVDFTVQWYKAWHQNALSAKTATLHQIEYFCTLAKKLGHEWSQE